jgi:hypothetical protein
MFLGLLICRNYRKKLTAPKIAHLVSCFIPKNKAKIFEVGLFSTKFLFIKPIPEIAFKFS